MFATKLERSIRSSSFSVLVGGAPRLARGAVTGSLLRTTLGRLLRRQQRRRSLPAVPLGEQTPSENHRAGRRQGQACGDQPGERVGPVLHAQPEEEWAHHPGDPPACLGDSRRPGCIRDVVSNDGEVEETVPSPSGDEGDDNGDGKEGDNSGQGGYSQEGIPARSDRDHERHSTQMGPPASIGSDAGRHPTGRCGCPAGSGKQPSNGPGDVKGNGGTDHEGGQALAEATPMAKPTV